MAFFQTASNIPCKEVSLTPATWNLLADNGEAMISPLHTVVGICWVYQFKMKIERAKWVFQEENEKLGLAEKWWT